MLYILLIPAVVLALLILPMAVAFKKRKDGKSVKNAFIGNICSFFAVMLICAALPIGISAYADSEEETTSVTAEAEDDSSSSSDGMLYLASALAVGLGSIGGGIAVAAAAPAAIGAFSENEGNFGKALIFVALGEGVAIYGLLISILIINSLG